jgi:hypothetical protein
VSAYVAATAASTSADISRRSAATVVVMGGFRAGTAGA